MRYSVKVDFTDLIRQKCKYSGCIHNQYLENGSEFCYTFEKHCMDEDDFDVLGKMGYEVTCHHCETDQDYCPCGGALEWEEVIIDGMRGYMEQKCQNINCDVDYSNR